MVRTLRIALVEDDRDLAQGWQDILELDNHKVHVFLNGRDVLRAEDVLKQCDVLVCDYYLPDLNGIGVIERVKSLRPDLPVILLTGARETSLRDSLANFSRSRLLQKPLRIETFEQALEQLIFNSPGEQVTAAESA